MLILFLLGTYGKKRNVNDTFDIFNSGNVKYLRPYVSALHSRRDSDNTSNQVNMTINMTVNMTIRKKCDKKMIRNR